jgi:type II secretory pathway pseudopilin PulG
MKNIFIKMRGIRKTKLLHSIFLRLVSATARARGIFQQKNIRAQKYAVQNFCFSSGLILVNVLVFSVIALIITMALVSWGTALLKSSEQIASSQQAFEIAESGIDYYRWHLSNLPTDYYDGNASTTSPGPYVHTFQDKNGTTIGQFSLTITPPATGTTVVTVKSKGTTFGSSTLSNVSRSIQAQFAIPSFAQYAVVANAAMYFGAGTVIYGPVQSNYGIHFDGIAHNIVSSAVSEFVDPDLNNGIEQYGVYTTGDPTGNSSGGPPPLPPPADSSIFLAGRQFPVPVIDFGNITTDLSSLEALAQTSGSNYGSSGALGYYILLHTNDTYDIYKVTSLVTLSNSCSNNVTAEGESGWGSWSIANKTLISSGLHFPASGVIFLQDNLWVEGSINTARLTIAVGVFPPSTSKSITVNNNLTYTNFNGQDVLGLVSQNNINVGFSSADNLTIDAALIAQNGRVGRYYYSTSCTSPLDPNYPSTSANQAYYDRTTLNLDGMIASFDRYGFAWTGCPPSDCPPTGYPPTGYTNRNIAYDSNLLYGPPPDFPLATSQYSTISWDEVGN